MVYIFQIINYLLLQWFSYYEYILYDKQNFFVALVLLSAETQYSLCYYYISDIRYFDISKIKYI